MDKLLYICEKYNIPVLKMLLKLWVPAIKTIMQEQWGKAALVLMEIR